MPAPIRFVISMSMPIHYLALSGPMHKQTLAQALAPTSAHAPMLHQPVPALALPTPIAVTQKALEVCLLLATRIRNQHQ
jgi:hypothetical protein